MKFDDLYKKVIDSCKAFEERQVPIHLDFKIEDLRDALIESYDTIEKLVGAKKSAEKILQNLLDCGLIKEWFFNGKFNAVLKADDPHLQIAELKAENQSSKQELQAIRRALWLMTAEWATAMGLASCNIANKFQSREKFEVGDDYREKTIKKYRHRQVVFYKYADYCMAKAENPQNPTARNKKPLRRDMIRGERLDEDCKRANTTVEYGKCLCYGLIDNAENTIDKCKKCKAYVWNDEYVNGIKEANK